MMTRVWKAQDWESGYELSSHLLGRLSRLQVHHIFPRALLYKHDYSRPEVNAVANFTFLTQETNLRVSDREPADYLEEYAAKFPGAVESHWIPMDRQLWRPARYRDFLAARRELMAKAANDFLTSLVTGTVPKDREVESILARGAAVVPGAIESDQEERLIQQCNDWVVEQGLPHGQRSYELLDPETTEPLATLDLAWPDGLQAGLSTPVALVIGEGDEIKAALNQLGYRYFTNLQEFQSYVRREVLVLNG
jgi:hypothetical protein